MKTIEIRLDDFLLMRLCIIIASQKIAFNGHIALQGGALASDFIIRTNNEEVLKKLKPFMGDLTMATNRFSELLTLDKMETEKANEVYK